MLTNPNKDRSIKHKKRNPYQQNGDPTSKKYCKIHGTGHLYYEFKVISEYNNKYINFSLTAYQYHLQNGPRPDVQYQIKISAPICIPLSRMGERSWFHSYPVIIISKPSTIIHMIKETNLIEYTLQIWIIPRMYQKRNPNYGNYTIG